MKPTMDAAALDAIDSLRPPTAHIPGNAFTVMHAAERWGLSRQSAGQELLSAFHAGKLARGKRGNVMWYWPVNAQRKDRLRNVA